MKYLLKKLMTLIITLLFVSFAAFLAFQIIPGDTATALLGTEYTPERGAEIREELGLNAPITVRYFQWISDFLKGDLGTSYSYKIPVKDLIMGKLPVTITLTVISFLLVIVISIPIGLLASKYGRRKLGFIFDIINQTFMAIPSFFLGILIIFIFGLILKWFTPGQYIDYYDNLPGFIIYLIPAAFAIAIPKIAMIVKFIMNGIMDQMNMDYVRTAYSKGNTENAVLMKHVLKNALLPVVTLLGMIVAETLAGSIIVEQVFNLPGIGRTLISAIGNRDYPVVQAIVVYIAFVIIVVNFIVDILYRILDPRVTLES